MSDDFKRAAGREIERFKVEYRQRYPDRDPDALTDQDLLREVMNTVGKPGRLGEHVKCVVSVSMLTEGWDVNTVTHILGVRAFSTQLICEQVVGRALRRISYVPNEDLMFDAEYAEVYGVPFSFVPAAGVAKQPRLPKIPTHIQAEDAGDDDPRLFRFPNVTGYRYELDDAPLTVAFDEQSRHVLTSADLPNVTENAPLIGETSIHTLEDLYRHRDQAVIFRLAKHVLEHYFREDGANGEPKVWFFPQLLGIVREWIAGGYVTLKDDCHLPLLMLSENRHKAAEKIYRAIVHGAGGDERLRLIIDADAPAGSSAQIDFETTKQVYRTDRDKCHVNYVAIDSGWEAKMAQSLETMDEVLAYVKNQGMNLRVPYTDEGREHDYIPDFLARIKRDDGQIVNFIIEVTGQRYDAKEAKTETVRKLWLPGVNALGEFGRWEFIEILDPWDAKNSIRRALKQIEMTENA